MRSAMTPRPETPGLSSLSANSSWWPTQMQIVGRSARMRSRRTVSSPRSLRRSIEAPNAPTPGSMMCEAVAISSARSATRGSAPRRRKAACTEARLAVPVGAIRTSGNGVTQLGADRGIAGRGHVGIYVDRVQRERDTERGQLDGALADNIVPPAPAVHASVERRLALGARGRQEILEAGDEPVLTPLAGDMLTALRRVHLGDHERASKGRG